MNIRRILNFSIILLSLPFLLSCGEAETESDNVTINYIAQTVILADSAHFPPGATEPVTITGPWFRVMFYGNNASDKEVVISAITGEITGNGQTVNWTPDFNSAGGVLTIQPGESFQDLLAIVDGLPKSENPNYKVKIKFEGWFSMSDDETTEDINEEGFPGDNFRKIVSFKVKSD